MSTVREALAALNVFAVVIENDRVVEVRKASMEELAAWSDDQLSNSPSPEDRQGGATTGGRV